MKVEVVRDDLEKEEKKELELDEGSTVKQLLDKLGVERQEVLVSKNGSIVTDNHEVEQDDEIKVMDVIAGG